MTQRPFLSLVLVLILAISTRYAQSQDQSLPGWTHFSIDPILPGSSWGTGGPALAEA